MLIDEQRLVHWIDHFYGYGSWQARIWFVSHDEGGGETPEGVADKLNYFHDTHPQPEAALCDIREMYKRVAIRWESPRAATFDNFYEYRFGKDAIRHAVWKNLAAFEHGYLNERSPDFLSYQQQAFLSPAANSQALIRLYPLPVAHNHGWYYSWLDMPRLEFLKTRALYQSYVFPARIHTILSKIATCRPGVVLMFGMENVSALKRSVQEFFLDVKFTLVKAVKQHTPQYHRADLNGTTLLITTQIPALRHNRVETGFNWEALGRLVGTR